eukprot:CAMPEP_0116937676 /NCGR_PEP_ID=MMETSP0467-20121206/31642_1 /TAXON_ID=283647 /ORGANISM="Mesodinium pulex, Strain SPMC105" /LENGTH=62 /DNA_ID=CAMNT_0004619529 /DNA_START=346 /DNA_END=534 /DNA_ORIENTATION=-
MKAFEIVGESKVFYFDHDISDLGVVNELEDMLAEIKQERSSKLSSLTSTSCSENENESQNLE